MARLPLPGADDGTWGAILNDFMQTAHNTDGTLKPITQSQVSGLATALDAKAGTTDVDAALATKLDSSDSRLSDDRTPTDNSVTTVKIGDGEVTELKLASAVQTKLNAAAPVTTVAARTGDVVLTKSDVGLTNIDNTSDAAKPISTATQAALDGKSPTSHGHTDLVAKAGANIAILPDSTTQFVRVNIPDDGSPTAGWPDRYVNYFNGTRTGYFNEYGEIRARPAQTDTVPLRVMSHASGSTANLLEVTDNNSATTYLSVSQTAAALSVPLTSSSTIAATNIGAKVIVLNAADPVPTGTPVGTVILRRP